MEFLGSQPTVDLTYADVFLVPRRSAVTSRLDVQLRPGDGTPATLPLVAANMNSVTGPRLAAVLARRGGLAVLPQDLSLAETEEAIRWVKAQPVAVDSPLVLGSEATAAAALRLIPRAPGQIVVIADRSAADVAAGRVPAASLRGILSAERLAAVPADARVGDLVHGTTALLALGELADPRLAFDAVVAATAGAAASDAEAAEAVGVIDGDALVGTLTRRSALRRTIYSPAVDGDGRLAVAAAVGINGDVAAKARALVAAGADVLVVDTAHGHQEGMLRALRTIGALGLGRPIVAGNIVTADGVHDLVDAGATILKVGVGPGAMCTTRMMTAVGRPQFSAVLEAAAAARDLGAHVWADGGVRYPRDVALALAAGAASVMIGSWFAGTAESPGELLTDADGQQYKESWGMASAKAVHGRFGGLDPYELARKELFAEGISSSKILLDPQRPSVEDLVDMITSGVRSSFTYAGATDLAEFHTRARVGLQSAAGYEEGKALPVSW
ncbi:GuaB1 family IMP dehydrogenase-related protein [Leucobacter luti]|uniref:GMP reductase n=1 Tax=Leucobacter luti TaxID=340320 RepID=A0A4Q7U5F8_9MICO|nr:GuaB1 family IMP dehydrogenase-related protein [Leucobacter luti]MBL3700901.1 GuaB1 family IMP dehydrogenase-related protein [Leucobacter luti]RZT68881.1 IMP dehydrogenase [Leucobacter luti]